MPTGRILIIDDEPRLRELYARVLGLEGYEVKTAERGEAGLRELEKADYHLCLLDVKLPDANGVDLTAVIRRKHPLTEVIVVTAYGTIEDGVRAMQNGAANYLTKGDSDKQIVVHVHAAVERARLARKADTLTRRAGWVQFEDFIGIAPNFLKAKRQAQLAAAQSVTVLLTGETGTGKEWFAQAIHQASPRSRSSFVALNCAAIPRDMLESELFGYQKGAFTGAVSSKRGLVAEADGGTLFLDEVGELAIELQAKLLRVLETGEYYVLGDSTPRRVDFRLVCATHRNLAERVKESHFREDLYYRISVFELKLPPLRERKQDIPALAEAFLHTFAPKIQPSVKGIDDKALQKLMAYHWPGNLRELRNAVERALILAQGSQLTDTDFSMHSLESTATSHQPLNLAELEKDAILRALSETNGNRTKGADLLGIAASTLYRKLDEYGLS
jgi:two-component system, NtrC family, response regulator